MDSEIKAAFAEWLGRYHWDYFLTVTFREPLPPHRGQNVLNSIARTIKRVAGEPRMLFLGMEQHTSSFLHCHGLYMRKMGNGGLIYAHQLWKPLFDTYGYSRVEEVRSQSDAAKYVTKYCVKALADYLIV